MGEIAGVFVALFVAHQVGDHWSQTEWQAAHKGAPGWLGRWACLAHVASYTLTAAVALLALMAATGWRPGLGQTLAGLAVSAVTHYIADRRTPLRRLAELVGRGGFYRAGQGGGCIGTGAYALDQSFHYLWLFVAALIIAA